MANCLKITLQDCPYEEFKHNFEEYVLSVIGINDPEKAEELLVKSEKIKCLYCMDLKKCWKLRTYMPFSALDLRGSFDIIRCPNCSDGEWIGFSLSNNISEKNKKMNRYPIDGYDDILRQIFVQGWEEKQDQPKWILWKDENISKKIKENYVKVDIQKLTDEVCNIIRVYAGDLGAIKPLISNLDASLHSLYYSVSNYKEMYETLEIDDDIVYIFFKISKEYKLKKTYFGLLNFNSNKYSNILNVHFTIARPKNKAAQIKCNLLMNAKIDKIIEKKRRDSF